MTPNQLNAYHFQKGRALDNEHLRAAITRSGLTLEEFADIVGVDVKTVQRWLAGRTPYPRHRTRVAGALDTTEHALWPDSVPAPNATGAHELTTPVTGDAIAGYGHATDPTAPNTTALLSTAVERIEIAIPNLASQPGLVELFRTRATNGRQARIIIEDPDEQVEPLLGTDAIEIRVSPAGENHILYRADDEMLLVLTRIGSASASPPIIHLRRQADGGLFDRLADDFDDRWLQATPLTSREQLQTYLADSELEPWPEPEHSPAADPQQARALARSPEAPTTSSADAPRRWPRRPT
jgi:transcriptional regulator with XRE-family HTH domain